MPNYLFLNEPQKQDGNTDRQTQQHLDPGDLTSAVQNSTSANCYTVRRNI